MIKIIKQFISQFLGFVTVYLFGYFNFSIAWIWAALLLIFLTMHWKNSRIQKLAGAREAALTDERQMIKIKGIRAEDLPSWVFFPDKVFFMFQTSNLG